MPPTRLVARVDGGRTVTVLNAADETAPTSVREPFVVRTQGLAQSNAALTVDAGRTWPRLAYRTVCPGGAKPGDTASYTASGLTYSLTHSGLIPAAP